MPKKIKGNNNVKTKVNYKIQLAAIIILTIALVLVGWGYIFQESHKYKNSILESYRANQEILVAQVTSDVQEFLETSINQEGITISDAERNAVKTILKTAETSGSKYWFFYSSDGVIFEKNDKETLTVEGKTLLQLIQYWKVEGGSSTDLFEELILQDKNGSILFAKDSESGTEIVSLRYFTVAGKKYYLGMSTAESYVMTSSRVNEHILYLLTFSVLVSLDIIIFSLLLCLSIFRNHRDADRFNQSIVDKNLKIQELNRQLVTKNEAVQNASVYDNLTKLYNGKFFDNLLSRLDHDLIMPVSVVIIDINGLGQLNAMEGYGTGDMLLEQTAKILHNVCIDTDVVARTGSSEFTILMTGTKESEAYGTAKNVKRQFANLDNSDLTLSVGVSQMHPNQANIFLVLEAARKNLILEKLLDVNSNTNSIISMLMATLNAYSKETVAHSDRLRETAVRFGRHLGMAPSELSRLAVAAQLHDVGKIGIPDSILNKKEALADHERELIRRHSELGYNIVKAIPFLDDVAFDILQHHEAYDGSGYPAGLRGEEISLNARIIHIIDSYDAMTNTSVYSRTKTKEEALSELQNLSNGQFEPYLVKEFVRAMEMYIGGGTTRK